jgi:hypothetical protein
MDVGRKRSFCSINDNDSSIVSAINTDLSDLDSDEESTTRQTRNDEQVQLNNKFLNC